MEASIVAKVTWEISEKNERDVRFYLDIGSNGEIEEIEREDNRNCRENKESRRDEKDNSETHCNEDRSLSHFTRINEI